MKKILLIFLAALWLVPGVAMAHSTLEVAVPAKDATVQASPEKIELTFNTKIEKLSNFKLLNAAGEQIQTGETDVDGATMSGGVPEPLASGVYTVKWTIIGADGHSVEGEYAFTVDAPEPSVEPSPTVTPEASAEADGAEPSPTPSAEATADAGEPAEEENGAAGGETQGTNYAPAIVIGVIIVAAALVLFLRRRKP
ncbi:copper resistance CopC family protein [Paenibacillus arenilitoris]|uniref:Copper resistance protein CopC n=1 Tax=Paenibacillus arenilitoris TaxID=2772299 RepID=A0A927CLT8_9BACL|nr:copper resistance protein CopC [Paenibacillus arenilitoris]MBD2870404.1 copper resistance protein CopC [Paenibacillus arenilitoris]